MAATESFGEHKKSIRVAEGAAETNSEIFTLMPE